ncbi:phosphoribosylpyrophosphate synthetase [Mucilaginibacter sp. JC4]|uniref:Phosphoribosylpyrophosphate synthetase n=2 Tax=Mucilaginibacter aquariorum TaxID=2967225 RepID=A0ABT1T1Q4_9SPHI|nr:phosphoribosylpyrophosphate synthetase [Mucilaginibacter aquariorum]
MGTMTTVSEVISKLQQEGYTTDFNLKNNCLECQGNALEIHPEEFVVDKHYRFEGQSDPADQAIVYAISSTKHDIKGILVNGYGTSSEMLTEALVNALDIGTGKKAGQR